MILRFFSFFPSVIDHDESTYIIIANALRHGDIYLRDVIDTKPIGIFSLFAFFQVLFGKSIMMIRIITAVWIALTGWLLYLVHRQFISGTSQVPYNPAPAASGIIYVIITSIFTTYGVSPNTEHFFVLFTLIALLITLKHGEKGWFLFAGFLLGLGFMIKYVVAFDALAIGIFYIFRQIRYGKAWSYWFTRCTLMVIGFVIPFMITLFYYYGLGMTETFLFYSFELSGRYFIKPTFSAYIFFIMESMARFLPVTIWYFYCLGSWRKTGAEISFLGLTWGISVMTIILLPGKLFPHYFIQLMIPMSLVAGCFFDPQLQPGRALSWMRKPAVIYSWMIAIVIINLIFQKIDYYVKPDYPRIVSSYLTNNLKEGDKIYTGDYHPIIYHLSNTQSPTPFIHNSLIWNPANSNALKINAQEELDNILVQQPRFILMKYPVDTNNLLYPSLQRSYTPAETFGNKVTVYRRN